MRYSNKQQQAALDCLTANAGDFQRTSAETGITVRTLRKWVDAAEATGKTFAPVEEALTVLQQYVEVSDPNEKLHEVLVAVVDNAVPISKSIVLDLEEATLSQKVAALNVLIGSAIKLLKLLPPVREQVVQFEFVDADGTAHKTPYWARNHPGEPDAL